MERYELTLLIEAIEYMEKTIERADDYERGLTHGQKHYLLQTTLIVLRDLKREYERQRSANDYSRKDEIPL